MKESLYLCHAKQVLFKYQYMKMEVMFSEQNWKGAHSFYSANCPLISQKSDLNRKFFHVLDFL